MIIVRDLLEHGLEINGTNKLAGPAIVAGIAELMIWTMFAGVVFILATAIRRAADIKLLGHGTRTDFTE